jgi:uncharacterized protein (DUF362 family)
MTINRRDFLKNAAAGTTLAATGAGMFAQSAFAINPSKFQAKSDVSFVGSSAEGSRREMIVDVLRPLLDTIAAGIKGKTILIKVNMVYWNPMLTDPTLSLTHVDAVRGLLEVLRFINPTIPIIIGDCTANDSSMGDVVKMFKNAGYNDLPTEFEGITLADLNTYSATNHNFWRPDFTASTPVGIPVIDAFLDPKYYVISICRPKTHSNMVLTGVNKNILMGAPLHSSAERNVIPKQFMHGNNGWFDGKNPDENKCLSYNLYQMANLIYSTGAPALSILDAWEGMEGDGPATGTSIMQYCAVAGIDPLAVDRLAAKLMGLSDTPTEPMDKTTPSYTDVRYLVWLSNAGFGNYDLNKINFVKGSLADVEKYVKTYVLPTNYTGDPSYETNWSAPAPSELLPTAVHKKSRHLDPKPYLVPQLHKTVAAGRVNISFSLPVSFGIRLGIFNLNGAEIRRLDARTLESGRYTAVWDCRDDAGRPVSAGQYLIKLSFDSRSLSDRVTIVR